MSLQSVPVPDRFARPAFQPTIPTNAYLHDVHEERLPFTVRLVSNEQDLRKAVEIRHAAYARHMPTVAETLKEPEALDRDQASAVLLAESKLDGSPIGTIRLQTNRYQRIALEKAVRLPDWLQGKTMAHVSRLGVAQGMSGRLVKTVLIKASFQYCEANDIDWAVVAARTPLDRQYAALMFEDIFPEAGFVALQHMNNVPHRLMSFEIASGKTRWTEAQHPLLAFFCNTYHPDIDVVNEASPPVAMGRALKAQAEEEVRMQ